MGSTVEEILNQYCEIQGIELKNKDAIIDKIESELDAVVMNVVEDMGDIVKKDQD